MLYPGFDTYRKLSEDYNVIPVYREILVDMETPISIYKKAAGGPGSYLLESVEGGEHLARYSFIGLEPFLTYSARGSSGRITRDGVTETVEGKPLAVLDKILAEFHAPVLEDLPRFYGGAVGYFGYDLVRGWEDLPPGGQDDLEVPDCRFVLTGLVLIFDHVKHQLKIVCNSRVGADPAAAYRLAEKQVERVLAILQAPNPGNAGQTLGQDAERASMGLTRSGQVQAESAQLEGCPVETPQGVLSGVRSNLTREEYMAKVERAKEYIRAGDIFQVVLSQRFQAPLAASPFDIYRSLRTVNPAPYLYFLNLDDTIIVGSSPEMLVRVEDGQVETRPIAGTRPRGKNNREDQIMAAELLADEKEKAEHLMLVDLGRNDLGRVCEYGSVGLTEFMKVERYSHVMHMVTQVEGRLKEGLERFAALEACFPAGTVSGAPKIRAMEIIDELEPQRRGPYAGAIGYLSFTGNMDTCITIRTLVVRNGRVYVQAGAGIVADSDPASEYQETVNKAMALLKTLDLQGSKRALA